MGVDRIAEKIDCKKRACNSNLLGHKGVSVKVYPQEEISIRSSSMLDLTRSHPNANAMLQYVSLYSTLLDESLNLVVDSPTPTFRVLPSHKQSPYYP